MLLLYLRSSWKVSVYSIGIFFSSFTVYAPIRQGSGPNCAHSAMTSEIVNCIQLSLRAFRIFLLTTYFARRYYLYSHTEAATYESSFHTRWQSCIRHPNKMCLAPRPTQRTTQQRPHAFAVSWNCCIIHAAAHLLKIPSIGCTARISSHRRVAAHWSSEPARRSTPRLLERNRTRVCGVVLENLSAWMCVAAHSLAGRPREHTHTHTRFCGRCKWKDVKLFQASAIVTKSSWYSSRYCVNLRIVPELCFVFVVVCEFSACMLRRAVKQITDSGIRGRVHFFSTH